MTFNVEVIAQGRPYGLDRMPEGTLFMHAGCLFQVMHGERVRRVYPYSVATAFTVFDFRGMICDEVHELSVKVKG